MKNSLLARLPILAAFLLSMGTLMAGTVADDPNCPRPCCPECQKGGCPLPGASKENPQPCEESCAKDGQKQKRDCDKPCPEDGQDRQGEQEAPQP